MANDSMTDVFGDAVIFTYSRSQAIADGVLIDVSRLAKEAGFKVPVAMTEATWSDCVAWSEDDSRQQTHQDETGRLWDVLSMAVWTIRGCREPDNPLLFDVQRIAQDGCSTMPRLMTLKLVLGPGDFGEPVATIMLPHED